MDLPIKIKLQVPVQHGSETVSELVIDHQMTANDIKGLKIMQIEDVTVGEVLLVIGGMANQPPSVMGKVDPKDLSQIFNAFSSFF
jgi:hypothetical protein